MKPGRTSCASSSATTNQNPCTAYEYGGTEDYTINVVRPEGSPASTIDTNEIVFNSDINDDPVRQIKIKKTRGSGQLDLNYRWLHPPVPPQHHFHVLRSEARPSEKVSVAPLKQDKEPHVSCHQRRPFVLTYAGDYNAATGASYSIVRFAHYYPLESVAAIKGMEFRASTSTSSTWLSGTRIVYLEKPTTEKCTPPARCFTARTSLRCQRLEPHTATCVCHPNRREDRRRTPRRLRQNTVGSGSRQHPATSVTATLTSYDDVPSWWSLADLGADANLLIPRQCRSARLRLSIGSSSTRLPTPSPRAERQHSPLLPTRGSSR